VSMSKMVVLNGVGFDLQCVWTQFTVSTGKRSGHPRGMPLVTRMFVSSEHAWDPMASSSVNFCRKTCTVPMNQIVRLCKSDKLILAWTLRIVDHVP
jgi:hypothetical protein